MAIEPGREGRVGAQARERLSSWCGPLFDRVVQAICPWPGLPFRRRHPWIWRTEESLPDIDVLELGEGQIVVWADLTAVRLEDVEPAAEGDMLLIRARWESEEVEGEAVEASYQDGVLEVKIPRLPAAEAKKMEVQVERPRSHDGVD